MKRESRFTEFTDAGEGYITPTDIKQYVFCPRVTYFTKVMQLRPIVGSQQDAAKKSHDRLAQLEKRRESILKTDIPVEIESKSFEVYLRSERLQAHGVLDMLVVTTDGEHIPIEFKAMSSNRGAILLDHKYQLVLLARLLEHSRDVIVRRGFVHYMNDDQTVKLVMTDNLRGRVKTYTDRISNMLREGTIPAPRARCQYGRVGCGFADRCADF